MLVHTGFGQLAKSSANDKSEQVWKLPFASKENTISLTVSNNANTDASGVSIELKDVPKWLVFKSTKLLLKDVHANSSSEGEFTFDIDRKAPVGEETRIVATIRTSDEQEWTREIAVSVDPPKDYKLYDNFPNPFNPATKIGFELPKATHLKLIIYDIAGREVAKLADGEYPAGYTELQWDGKNRNGQEASSGVYFCMISTQNWGSVKKMMMLK